MSNLNKTWITPIKDFLRLIHHRIPANIRNSYAPLYWKAWDFFNTNIKTLLKIRLPVVVFKGSTVQEEHPLTFAYAGINSSTKAYWSNRIFAPGFEEHCLGTCWVWNIRRILKQQHSDCNLTLIESSGLTSAFLSRKPGFTIPQLIELSIDITKSMEELRKKSKGGFQDIHRRIRKHQLAYEITRDHARFDEFFHKMHTPFIKDRYTNEAVFISYPQAKKVFSHSELFLTKEQEKILSGITIEYEKKNATMRLMGVNDQYPDAVRKGAIGALYYFPIIELQKKGYSAMNLGGTPAILTDSLTRYKLALTAQIIPHTYISKKCSWLILQKDSPGLRTFLKNNPFVFYPDNLKSAPSRALFIEGNQHMSEKEFKKIFRLTNCKGLFKTHIFVFCSNSGFPDFIDPQVYPDLILKPANDCFIESYKE